MVGNGEMGMVRTVEGGAHALDEFRSWQDSGGLDHSPFAVHPLGFDGVQPRALTGKEQATIRTP
jgi:hypothetical protein